MIDIEAAGYVPTPGILAPVVPPHVSEAGWQTVVVNIATMYGWLTYHNPDSRRMLAGWPDLALVHQAWRRLVVVELKKRGGRVRPDQRVCLRALAAAGTETALWRPADIDTVIAVLGPRRQRAALPAEAATW